MIYIPSDSAGRQKPHMKRIYKHTYENTSAQMSAGFRIRIDLIDLSLHLHKGRPS